jgi:hypothetical protein
MLNTATRPYVVEPAHNLYRWATRFHSIQIRLFDEDVALRRERRVVDFVRLNGYQKLWIDRDTDVLEALMPHTVEHAQDADLIIITDLKFSRWPCEQMLEQIQRLLVLCPNLYLCLNRNYINIDDSYVWPQAPEHYPRAITQWLQHNLQARVIDVSDDFLDSGESFSWALPDRHYVIYA